MVHFTEESNMEKKLEFHRMKSCDRINVALFIQHKHDEMIREVKNNLGVLTVNGQAVAMGPEVNEVAWEYCVQEAGVAGLDLTIPGEV